MARDGRPELRKIQIMIQDLPGVIEHRAARAANNLLQRQPVKLRPRQRRIQIVDIPLQMLPMMERQRPRADHRLQRLRRVRQINKCKHMWLN